MAYSGQNRKQEAFVAALLTQGTVEKAAEYIGIGHATATRWLKEPAFKQLYADARQQALGETLNYLQSSMLSAVRVLIETMEAPGTSATTKVRAAVALLELGLKGYEVHAITLKLEELLNGLAQLRSQQSLEALA